MAEGSDSTTKSCREAAAIDACLAHLAPSVPTPTTAIAGVCDRRGSSFNGLSEACGVGRKTGETERKEREGKGEGCEGCEGKGE